LQWRCPTVRAAGAISRPRRSIVGGITGNRLSPPCPVTEKVV
jgi:hypothetical protein